MRRGNATPTHDAAGNLTYDAWNRQTAVTKAYPTQGGGASAPPSPGSIVSESAYDGLNRRIIKAVQNSADFDATYHTYYSGRMVHTPQSQAEAEALRRSVNRGSPFGGEQWTRRIAARLGLESTLRPRGRPPQAGAIPPRRQNGGKKVECPLFCSLQLRAHPQVPEGA